MQAIVLFTLFGLMAAVFGGYIGQMTESTQSLIRRQVEAQQQAFEDIAVMVDGWIVPQNMESPGSGASSNPGTYICSRSDLRQVATCTNLGGTLTLTDQWGRGVTGYQVRATTAFSGQTPAGVFSVQGPVTGYVLVSAGPDGKVDGRLQSDLSGLRSSSSLNDVLRLQAYRSASSPAAAADSLDDIVLTFSDQRAQEKNFAGIQDSLNRVAVSALKNYGTQFRQFQSNLSSVYSGAFSGGSPIVINDSTLNLWQSSGDPDLPKFNGANYSLMGVEGDAAAIERAGATGHFNLTVQTALSGKALDIYLTTTPSAFAWKFVGSRNCAATPSVNCIRVQL